MDDPERALFLSSMDRAIEHLRALTLMCAGLVGLCDTGTVAAKNARIVYEHAHNVRQWLEQERLTRTPKQPPQAPVEAEKAKDEMPAPIIH